MISRKIENVITLIDGLIPKGRSSKAKMIMAFEAINHLRKNRKWLLLSDIGKLMKNGNHPQYDRFDKFFLAVHQIIREQAEQSDFYKENLIAVAVNQFLSTSKILEPKYHDLFKVLPTDYDLAHAAYQYVLDQYRATKGQYYHNHWFGYWSLITTNNGQVTGCYLSDTADREYYFEFASKNYKKILGRKLI